MRPSSSTGDYRGWPGAPACTHRAPTATFGETSPKAEVDRSYLHCYVYHKLCGDQGLLPSPVQEVLGTFHRRAQRLGRSGSAQGKSDQRQRTIVSSWLGLL